MAETSAVTNLARTLRELLEAFPPDRALALVGGLAVSARTEPRFTRDLDFAIAVENDAEAESIVFGLQGRGFTVVATIEHATMHRLATVRLRQHARAPFVDLLFASCGIEPEIVGAASPLEILGATAAVATVGHLIAMKLVSRDPKRRPRDQQDLVELARAAGALEWKRAEASIELIEQRGFSRGRDLAAGLAEIRSLADE
ncbi:MAG TPA: nucleotidyl transferase AbiEii/AbiGii toxin family protein [Kofleriaceae bacterium]|nr:nucleotidyl transferase AbiEii/AbiGii toxin family protein [Kofleriaceae bacterium]